MSYASPRQRSHNRLTHANKGKDLETIVMHSQGDLVRLTQLHAAARFIPDRARGGMKVIATKGPVDFIGTARSSGRGIHFDAKKESYRTGFKIKSHLEAHQELHLHLHGSAGAIAGVLVESTEPTIRKYFWIDWRIVTRHWSAGSAYVPWEEMIELGPSLKLINFANVPGIE